VANHFDITLVALMPSANDREKSIARTRSEGFGALTMIVYHLLCDVLANYREELDQPTETYESSDVTETTEHT
jgi:hypothetical protein